MKIGKAGGAGIVAPPAGAPRWEMLMKSTHWESTTNAVSAGNWKTIGALSNGVVRRVRFIKARH